MPLAFLFLSPLLFAAGAACVSIPIVIHLLNKRKFRTVVWAAMDFLLAAQRRNARKLKFRRWLLLACRCLALLLLAAGIARLVVQNTLLAAFSSGQKAYVVVWDDSYSMAYQPQGPGGARQSPFERSKRLLVDWLPTLEPSDKVMIIHASRGGTTANGGANNRPTLDKQGLHARVAASLVTDASTDLPAALDQAADALKDLSSTVRTRELVILTDASNSALRDLQRPAADAAAAQNTDRLKKALAAAAAQTTAGHDVRLLDLGSPDQANMAVTDLQPVHPIVVAGTQAEFHVTVLNATDKPALDVPLSILLDGVAAHGEKLSRIDPGSARTLTVALTLPTPGRHVVEARLPADNLPVDDDRSLLLNVRRTIPLLLVDGSPGDTHTLGSTTYLQVAFALSASDKPDATPAAIGGGFAPHVITELELPTTALPQYAAVVLSDTTTPNAPAIRDALRKYVENGGLLMIFPGGHTNAQDMNAALGAPGLAPDALLPAAIGQVVKTQEGGALQTGTPFAPEGFTHPVLQPFGEAYKSGQNVGFTSVQTTQYLKLTPPADGSSEVILRYARPDGTPGDPAVVERQVGKGRVVLFASTADTQWNNFGAEPSYVPFMHELMYYAIPGDSDALTLRVGDSVHLPQDMAPAGAWNGPRNTTISVTSEIRDGRPRLVSGPLALAGSYTPANATDGRPVVVVNPDAAEEADIRHVGPAALAAAIGLDPAAIDASPRSLIPAAAIAGNNPSQGSELARSLLLAALGFFLLETLLARLFSVYH